MADFDFVAKLVAEFGTDFGDDAKTRNAGWLVDENDSVFHKNDYNIERVG